MRSLYVPVKTAVPIEETGRRVAAACAERGRRGVSVPQAVLRMRADGLAAANDDNGAATWRLDNRSRRAACVCSWEYRLALVRRAFALDGQNQRLKMRAKRDLLCLSEYGHVRELVPTEP
jgi:hypothetical protein